MQTKDLQLKRALRTALLVLLLNAVGMAKGQYLEDHFFEVDGVWYGVFEDNPTCVAVVSPYSTGCTDCSPYEFVDLVLTNPVVHEYNDGYGMQHDEYTLVSIGNGAFAGCTSLVTIYRDPQHLNVGMPPTVTSIGEYAFYDCSSLTPIEIPNSVTSIGMWAFSECTSLVSIEIPNSVTSIENGTFEGCTSLTSIEIPNSVTTIGYTAFNGCISLTSIEIPNSVTYIGGSAFSGCTSLSGDLIIPNSVVTIDDGAFNGCSGFTGNLIIGNSVTSIGWNAFLDCSGFTGNLTIPNSVTTIGNNAFYGCSGFTGNLIIGNSVTMIGDEAFRGCSGLTSFNIPNSVLQIGCIAFGETGWYDQQPEGTVMYVDNWCMGYKESMYGAATGSLTLNEGIRGIAGCAFSHGCSGFTGDLVIPNSVITIGEYAFSGCSGFSGNLTIGNSVTRIDDFAFYGCSGFTGNLTIPNSVAYIGSYAFSGCSSFIGSLTIGNSVTWIGDRAFSGRGFISITSLAETPPTLDYHAFNTIWSNSIPVYVPCGYEGAYTSMPSWSWGWFSNYHGLCGGTVAVSATPEEGGTVMGGGSFEAGDACTVTATANEGYFLAEWTQDGTRVSTNSEYTFYVANDVELVAHFIEDVIINFADDNVKAICVSHWDTDGDGELSYSEAASVKSLGNYFKNNSAITSFDELQYFIGLSSIGDNAFSGCSGLTSIILPKSMISIGEGVFMNCSGLESIRVKEGNPVFDSRENCNAIIYTASNILVAGCKNTVIPNTVTLISQNAFYGCGFTGSLTIPSSVTGISYNAFYGCCGIDKIIMRNTTPPTLGTNVFCTTNPDFVIYVPNESLTAYKTAYNWRNYEPYIKPMFSPSVSGYASSTSNDKWTFIALPLANETDPATVLNLLAEDGGYDLYQFDQSAADEEWRNYKVDSFNLVNGRGYLYARAVDVNLVIGGDFNEDETKEVGLDYDAGKPFAGWNLVGNPFPVGAYINRSYYVMNATGSGIEPMAISSSTPVPVCAGVMVKAEMAGESVVFNRTAPSNRIDLGKLQIELMESTPNRDGVSTGSTTLDKAIVSFNQGDVLEKYVFNSRNAQIYIPQGGKDFAIANAEKVGDIPLNFKASQNGQYTVSVSPEHAEMDYLHLIDNMTGSDIDLLTAPSYTFEARTTDYASRFRLVFSVCGDADGDNESFAYFRDGEIVITADVFDASLQIVDVTGRVIVCRDGVHTVSTSEMTPGIYVLRLIDGEDVRTQKIVVK